MERNLQREKRHKTSVQPMCVTYVRPDWRLWFGIHLFDAIVKKGQTGVLVTDKGTLLDEADEYLSLGELGVELLVGTVSAFEKSCRKGKESLDCLYSLKEERNIKNLLL